MGETIDRIVGKLTETSTLRGIVAVVGAIAMVLRPDSAVAITASTLSLIGAINIIRQEPPK